MPRHFRALGALALLLAAGACTTIRHSGSGSEALAGGSAADAWTRCATLPDGDRAVYACREVVRSAPRSVSAHRALAERLEALERHAQALRSREAVARLDSTDATAVLELGQAQDRLGRKRDALRSYERFAELAPSEPRALELVGWMRFELGRYRDALDAFRAAAGHARASSQTHYGAALSLIALKRHEEAQAALETAIEHDSTRAEYWGQLAVTAIALSRVVEAVEYWDHAVRVDPRYFDRRAAERRQWEGARDQLLRAGVVTTRETSRRAGPASAPPAAAQRDTASAQRPTPPSSSSADRPQRAGSRDVLVGPDASGSGFMLARNGYVITNKHVVRACRAVQVRVGESTLHAARVVAADPDDDLALLKIEATLPAAVTFRDAPALRAGEDVVATGYPLNGLLADEVNVTVGTVSALAGMRNDRHVLQMTAPVQPGSSGGPLFDASGNLVGVVVTKLNARVVAEETGDIPQNVNFAVKATVLEDFLRSSGVEYRVGSSIAERSRADIGDIGRQVTVLVQCFR